MPRKHIEEPGIWHQGGTWARSAIPPAFPSGAMTWHTLERHLFPTERGRNILHSQTTKLLSLLPVLGRLTHSKQIQPQLSCSCSEGTSAHFTHRNKALPPGGDETVGIKTVLKYVLQNIYREIWLIFFFPRRMPYGALVVPHPTKQTWNCQGDMQGPSELLYNTHSDRPKICSLLPPKLAIYSL